MANWFYILNRFEMLTLIAWRVNVPQLHHSFGRTLFSKIRQVEID